MNDYYEKLTKMGKITLFKNISETESFEAYVTVRRVDKNLKEVIRLFFESVDIFFLALVWAISIGIMNKAPDATPVILPLCALLTGLKCATFRSVHVLSQIKAAKSKYVINLHVMRYGNNIRPSYDIKNIYVGEDGFFNPKYSDVMYKVFNIADEIIDLETNDALLEKGAC